MSADLSIITLVLEASFLVQLVMLLLLVASVMSWTVIFRKAKELKQTNVDMDEFERRFWSGTDLVTLHRDLSQRMDSLSAAETIFKEGFKGYARLKADEMDVTSAIEVAERSMRVAMNREVDRLEVSLSFLATVGSTSPYVGLFGTVWGIMNSFRALGSSNQATLAMVAPGIAEALIATAMGLFAAIPAVVAYNRYVNEVTRLANRYENFMDEFVSVLQSLGRKKDQS